MCNRSLKLLSDENGATAVEYAVMLALILVATISAISAVGNTTTGIWAHDVNEVLTATQGS